MKYEEKQNTKTKGKKRKNRFSAVSILAPAVDLPGRFSSGEQGCSLDQLWGQLTL